MKKGFTLVELLVVIAILALLMSIVIVTLNPAEILRKTRDTKRVSDLNSLRTALNLYVTDKASPDLDYGATDCAADTFFSLDTCPGTSVSQSPRVNPICAATSTRLVNGTGWVPVELSSISSGSPLSALPVDPTNATSSTPASNLYYTYACDSGAVTFEFDAQMESTYYKNGGDGDVVSKDGGDASTLFEVGSEPGLDLLATPSTNFYQ